MDYAALYSEFWSDPAFIGSVSFPDANLFAENIIVTCGRGTVLDAGCGEGSLVQALLARGIEAHGVDASPVAIRRAKKLVPGCFQLGNLCDLPFPDRHFDTVVCADVLEHLVPDDVPRALREIWRTSKRHVFLTISTRIDMQARWHLTVKNRAWWEERCLEAGFRFHPRELHVVPFAQREMEGDNSTIILEKIAAENLELPISRTGDFLRQSGRHAEGARQRYHMASAFIRRDDAVLDFGNGTGYGAHMLYQNSQAASVLGITGPPEANAYAEKNYALDEEIRFQNSGSSSLSRLPANSFDFITIFDQDMAPDAWSRVLEECFRLLRPSGRIMLGVRRQTALPAPCAAQAAVFGTAASLFMPERLFAQTVGDNTPTSCFRRECNEIALSGFDPAAAGEWMVLLAMKSPLCGRNVPYVPREDIPPPGWKFKDFAFAGDMVNPWIYYGLIHKGERFQEPGGLAAMRDEILREYPPSSTDYAAALCGKAYALYASSGVVAGDIGALLDTIAEWTAGAGNKPVHIRWKVSLFYVAGLLNQKIGRLREAEKNFLLAAEPDVLEYSPTLGTKTLNALCNAALLALERGDTSHAERLLQRAVEEPWRLLALGGKEVVGSSQRPLWWSLDDMRQILDAAHQASKLLFRLKDAATRPGLWAAHNSSMQSRHQNPATGDVKLRNDLCRLSRQRVYFWGCGEAYLIYKGLFSQCRPVFMLHDAPETVRGEVDGIPVRHPDDVLPCLEKLPLVLFLGGNRNLACVLERISRKYPRYRMDDIIIPWSPLWTMPVGSKSE